MFTRVGIRLPDLKPRPRAWCEACGHDVEAQQWWKKPGRAVGKYRSQYLYVCPVGNHGQLEPYVAPAAAAIDWSDLGEKIGDRRRPLAEKTMMRVRMGADLIASGRFAFSMAHGGRSTPIDLLGEPMRTWTTSDTEAMALAPDAGRATADAYVTTMRRHGGAEHVSRPLQTFAASGFHHSLVIPFRKGAAPHAVTVPQSTTATHSRGAPRPT